MAESTKAINFTPFTSKSKGYRFSSVIPPPISVRTIPIIHTKLLELILMMH